MKQMRKRKFKKKRELYLKMHIRIWKLFSFTIFLSLINKSTYLKFSEKRQMIPFCLKLKLYFFIVLLIIIKKRATKISI